MYIKIVEIYVSYDVYDVYIQLLYFKKYKCFMLDMVKFL